MTDRQEIWRGVAEIAAGIGESERRTFHLLQTGQIVPPAFQIGRRWYLRPETWEAHLRRLESGEAA